MTTTFTVKYERLVDGEFEPDTKDFLETEKDAALKFAEENYESIFYVVENENDNYKRIDFGYVSADGKLISQRKTTNAFRRTF